MAHAFKLMQKGHIFFPTRQPLLFITNIPFVIPCYEEQSTTSAGMQLKFLTGGNLAIGGYWNEGLNRTQNSPYTLNKTLYFVCLVRFIFTFQNSRSQKPLENSDTTKILVTSKKLSPHPRMCSFHIWYCFRILL